MTININLICQPSCSLFSSYFGGTQFDEIKSVCIDSNKNSYVIGNTYSTDLPVTLGLINDTASGNYDVFIAKFDSCGVLIWSTYFGGIGSESAEKMELTQDGNIVFCGYTTSLNTPTTTGCFQTNNNGGYDCFLTKINPSGTIIWSTYFGKSGGDFAFDLKTDLLGNIIIGGTSTSTNLYTNTSSFQPNHKGNTDAFIARFSKDGLLKWCTYYGGNGSEDIHALAIDRNCNIIGVGESFSNNLSTSVGAYQTSNNGSSDSYIIKLDSNCTRIFSSYIGGSGSDDAWGVFCDSTATIFLSGHTNSNDFYTSPLAYQTINNGGADCYLTKWTPTGTLLESTLFGGVLNDNSIRLVPLSHNRLLLLSGTENSTLPIYPNSNQNIFGGGYDIYLGVFDATTLQPTWGTYYGGSAIEYPTDIKLIDTSLVVFTGSSNSSDYPISQFAHQTILNNSTDGIITKINLPMNVVTSTAEKQEKLSIKVYPNPFTDFIIVDDTFALVTTNIKNIFGESMSFSINNNCIDTKHFTSGIYIITINSKAYRFIKQ